MSNIYQVDYRVNTNRISGPPNYTFTTLIIVTDSLQNAMAIARSRMPSGGEITNVWLQYENPIIDPASLPKADQP